MLPKPVHSETISGARVITLAPGEAPVFPAQPWYAFDPAGSPDKDGIVVVQCGPLVPGQPVVFTYPAQRAAKVVGLRVRSTVNGAAWTDQKTMSPIDLGMGDSIQFAYTLNLDDVF